MYNCPIKSEAGEATTLAIYNIHALIANNPISKSRTSCHQIRFQSCIQLTLEEIHPVSREGFHSWLTNSKFNKTEKVVQVVFKEQTSNSRRRYYKGLSLHSYYVIEQESMHCKPSSAV